MFNPIGHGAYRIDGTLAGRRKSVSIFLPPISVFGLILNSINTDKNLISIPYSLYAQVWIFLLVVVIAMAFALVYVPKLYLKFADVEMAVDEQHPSLPSQSSYASFYNSASNAILYLLTTLTNHGIRVIPLKVT